jgi:two-component system, LytTR family, sensor kinase
MASMPAPNAGELLNLVGFVTGTVLYAMLLALVLRTAAGQTDTSAGTPDRLPLATALLGLAWNLGELLAYTLPRMRWLAPSVWVNAVSFPALGLLAGVVVHSVARALPGGALITMVAYACSVAASLLHVNALVTNNPASSSLAFGLLTICFGAIIVPLAFLTRRQPNGRRALWMLALALFAVSASHLGRFHGGESNWLVELAGHHAAIPLAFAILYQDYRFALADLFLKNALTLLALVALAFAGYSVVASLPDPGPLTVGVLLGLWVGTAIVYPWLRRSIVRFVDTVLLGRGDYAQLRGEVGAAVQAEDSVAGALSVACERLARALRVRDVRSIESSAPASAQLAAAVQVPIHTADEPGYVLLVGELEAGRRLLSDDVAFVEHVAAIVGRRIDAIRLTGERFERRLRDQEMLKLAAEAELRALRAQINPHFLFNALTTIGYLIGTSPSRALQTLMRLTALLRGVLRSEGEFTTLGREVELVEHYLDIERERFEERLRVRVEVPHALRSVRVPSLIVQPLVENAVKHGVARSADGGDVILTAELRSGPGAPSRLVLTVRNTGASLVLDRSASRDGVGLSNVERRLAGHFGNQARLSLIRTADGATAAIVELPVIAPVEDDASVRSRVLV